MRTPVSLSLVLSTVLLLAVSCTRDDPMMPASPSDEAAFARRGGPPEPPGTFALCKVGGDGIDAGDVFAFDVILGGVLRVVEVGAGECLELGVPLEREPSSKGWYQRKADDVGRLLPAGTMLVVDGAALTSDQIAAILKGGSNVQATSSLLLNLVQQLIAADLNILRGAQPTPEVVLAIAAANAGVHVDPGSPIGVTTSLGQSELSALVNTLTAFNEGKLVLPPASAATLIGIVEAADPLTELVSIVCVPVSDCSGIDLTTGSVDASIASGELTSVTFTNRARPVLRVCKVAGAGVAAGAVYRFVAGGIDVSDAGSLNVAAGDCGDLELLEGTYMLAEVVPAGEAVQSIVCDPVSACSDASLLVGQVDVVVSRGLVTVTFTNRSTVGTLVICKLAGTGVEAGTMFHFAAGGINVNDAASYDIAAGDCDEAELEEGNYMTSEAVPPGMAVSNIACDPVERCANPSLAVGTVTATVVGATTTTVTFTNRVTQGTLRICKIAGPGVNAGTSFVFSAGGIDVSDTEGLSVPAGDCGQAQLEEGHYQVAEAVPPNMAVSAISCEPSTSCDNPSLTVGAVTALVTGGAVTTVNFTNRSTMARVNLCKAVDNGALLGQTFHFSMGGIDVPAAVQFQVTGGGCTQVDVPEGTYMVTEVVAPGLSVTAIECAPAEACANISLALGTLNATFAGAATTTITFTNDISPASALAPWLPLARVAVGQTRAGGRGVP